ncbi:MAG: anthranilate phosphoribosyltransferase [Actinomyces sp.]|nr:MAG: anthranilate phosphoribosyltransferase [Actinomyces sp.]
MTTLDELGGWPTVLDRLTRGLDLDAEQAGAALTAMLADDATPAQMAGFIVAMRVKGESVAEMSGMVEAMRDAAVPLTVPADAIDIVGVGGSPSRRESALNVSTMASVVAAAAGAVVCKHGNRRASSTSGSFDLLEALGVGIDLGPDEVERCVAEVGLAFVFARTFHPAMRHVAPVRAELGIPTVFNVLGPLSHPGRLTRQVIGVADWGIADRMIRVLAATGSRRAWLVHGAGGLDELTTTGTSRVLELDEGEITERFVDATDVGLARATPEQLAGGDAAANAEIARRVFAGESGPHRDIVVLNAAAGLVVAGVAADLADGVERAAEALDSGAAAAKLAALVAATT